MDDPTKCETGRLQCHTDIFCSLRPFGETFYFARMNKGKWEVSSRAGFMWECDFISKKWKFFFFTVSPDFVFSHFHTKTRERDHQKETRKKNCTKKNTKFSRKNKNPERDFLKRNKEKLQKRNHFNIFRCSPESPNQTKIHKKRNLKIILRKKSSEKSLEFLLDSLNKTKTWRKNNSPGKRKK